MQYERTNKRSLGTEYEDRAAEYLESSGYFILEHSFSCKMGEIDLIAVRDTEEGSKEYVFVEVKYRRTAKSGEPIEAVSYQKQRKICRTADFYRMKKRLPEYFSYRFDVIAFEGQRMKHYENAFYYIPGR